MVPYGYLDGLIELSHRHHFFWALIENDVFWVPLGEAPLLPTRKRAWLFGSPEFLFQSHPFFAQHPSIAACRTIIPRPNVRQY